MEPHSAMGFSPQSSSFAVGSNRIAQPFFIQIPFQHIVVGAPLSDSLLAFLADEPFDVGPSPPFFLKVAAKKDADFSHQILANR